MKNLLIAFPIISISLFMMIHTSCKKEQSEPEPINNNNNNNNSCNYTTNVLVIGSVSKNITSSLCSNNSSNYTSEQYIDSTHIEGLTMMFAGTTAPAAGTYTAINTVPVPAGKVYIEYFETTNSYQPSSGMVTVSDNGSSKIYSFCNLSFSNGRNSKTVSARATCN